MQHDFAVSFINTIEIKTFEQNIDLHALTGWIPERQSLRETDFDYAAFYEKIRDRFKRGHCLATISTGSLSEAEADRAGKWFICE